MTYEMYRYIFYVGATLAVILLIISVILFFVLNIPSVIGDLTGATARKAIEDIRNQNENSGEKIYRSSLVNKERGKLTDKISPSGNLIKNPTGGIWGAMATEKISTQKLSETTGNETTILDSNETTVLSNNETTVLNSNFGETTLLDSTAIANETTLLSQSMIFEIEYDITFIHTDEVIV